MSANQMLDSLLLTDASLKLTDLRKDILKIFMAIKNPLSAYQVLEKLKKKRPNAEPPTVYRVIDYFVDKKIIHRIDTENKYVFCTQLGNDKEKFHGVIFICRKCFSTCEAADKSFATSLQKISENHDFLVDHSHIEIKGVCSQCS